MTRILTLIILFSSYGLHGQSLKPAISMDEISIESEISSNLKSKLAKRLGSDYQVLPDSHVSLSADATVGKVTTINGMDTYSTAEVSMKYRVKVGSKSFDPLTITSKCKGKSERDLKYQLGTSIIRDRDHIEALEAYIGDAIQSALGSCAAVSKEVDAALARGKSNEAYSLLAYFDEDNCTDAYDKAEDKVLKAQQETLCAEITQNAEILANSSTSEGLEKATRLLLTIPPDASCSAEAIRISGLVAENAKSLSSYKSKQIQDRINIFNTMSYSDWKVWYRQNYYKYR